MGQFTTAFPGYFGGRPLSAEGLSRPTADSVSRSVGRLVSGVTNATASKRPSNKLPPFAFRHGFWHITAPADACGGSSRFYPPDCYQLSEAGTSRLLRIHLPPRTASFRPWVAPYAKSYSEADRSVSETIRGFPSYLWLPVNDAILNYTTGLIRYVLCAMLHTYPVVCRIRFACAMCRSLPITSFRPCRYQQRPCDSDCLPPDRGDARFFQRAGFAIYAGQTKKGET